MPEEPQPYALATVPLVQQMAADYNFGSELARFENTLVKTVFPAEKPVTLSQILMFLSVAKQYKLNPFVREIFAFPNSDGSIVPIVSVDGWITLAKRQEDYDGVEFEEKWETDVVGGVLQSVTAVIYHKSRTRPTRIKELMAECYRDTKQWKQKPLRMLRHKAFIQGLRYAFGFGGIYDEDEGERILEGTLKPTASGIFQSEISLPQRTAAPIPAGAPVKVVNAGPDIAATVTIPSGNVAFVEAQGEAKPELVRNPDPETTPESGPEGHKEVQKLVDEGLLKRASDLPSNNTIGRGRAQRLYTLLTKAKLHTEQELKAEFLDPLKLQHTSDLPLELYQGICDWAEGKTGEVHGIF